MTLSLLGLFIYFEGLALAQGLVHLLHQGVNNVLDLGLIVGLALAKTLLSFAVEG